MKPVVTREVARRLREQHGVATRSQLYAIGVTDGALRHRLGTGEWQPVGAKLVRLASAQVTPEQQLLGLCLAAGPAALASHRSAAWLWQMVDAPPKRHSLTVPRSCFGPSMAAEVHRPRDFPARIVTRRGIPCTLPARTLMDLASVVSPDEVEAAIDRSLAADIVTLGALKAELDARRQKGRPGSGALGKALAWRMPAITQPSVLESRTLRLLRSASIKPLGVEVKAGNEGTYRLDILLRPSLAMEVDGYAYHHSPAQMAEDARRRNRLSLTDLRVLVYTWRDVVYDGRRVLAEVVAAIALAGSRVPSSQAP
jgi:very-short-patch-repair endonuclease